MRNKILLYVLLTAIIFSVVYVHAASAYTIYDIAGYIQSLFSSVRNAVIGGVFQTTGQCYGGDDPDCNPSDDVLKWHCHPYRCSLYQMQNDKNGCGFAGCFVDESAIPWACTGNPNSCEIYNTKENCQTAGCFWGETTTTSSITPQPSGAIQEIRVSLLDSSCQPVQTWRVYPEDEAPVIPEQKTGDCPPGNTRINIEYKNTGSKATYFKIESQSFGQNSAGLRISTPPTLVQLGSISSHAVWIPMWNQSITEKNWLMASFSESGTFVEVEERDFWIYRAVSTTRCICENPDSANKHYTCTDGTEGNCEADETCYGMATKPDLPCRKATTTTTFTTTTYFPITTTSAPTTTTTPVKGKIINLRVNLLNKDCTVKYTWDVYPEGQTTLYMPAWKKNDDCPDGNMRINMHYKNTGQVPAYFKFVTETNGDIKGRGGEIPTPETKLNPGEDSSHTHWIRMWNEPVTQWNLLEVSAKFGFNVSAEESIDFRVINSTAESTAHPTGTLEGRVTNIETEKGLPATITITKLDDYKFKITFADDNGYYRSDLSLSKYMVEAHQVGYYVIQKEVEIRENGKNVLDFELKSMGGRGEIKFDKTIYKVGDVASITWTWSEAYWKNGRYAEVKIIDPNNIVVKSMEYKSPQGSDTTTQEMNIRGVWKAVLSVNYRDYFGDIIPNNYQSSVLVLPREAELGCIVVKKSGDPSDKLDIVFVPEKYSKEKLEEFESEVKTTAEVLLSKEPFASRSSRINIYLVRVADADLDCNNEGICNTNKVIPIASVCPFDVFKNGGTSIIVFMTTPSKAATGGMIATSVGRLPGVTLHEFGHSFGGLCDEYYYPDKETNSRFEGCPNCDVDPSCQKWKDVPDTGCFKGACLFSNIYRPTEISLMAIDNMGETSYGPVNERVLEKKLDNYR
jgi:hypothetical protein